MPASTTGAASARSRSTTSTRRRRGQTATGSPRRRARAGSSWRRGCPSTRATSPASGSTRPCCRPRSAPRTPSGSRARTPGTRARRARSRSSSPRDALPVDTRRRAGGGRARAPLPRPRRRARACLRRRRPAPARGLRRRGQLRRHAEHPVHERLLLPLRLLRLLEGEAGGEPPRRAVPRPARGDRPPRARGLGPRRDRGLPPGRDPPGLHRRVLRVRRRRDPDRAARAAHPRLLRARGLAGRGDARPPARGVPGAVARRSASARCRGRQPRSSTTRCGR